MISIPSIRTGLPFENSGSLSLLIKEIVQSGKSINLRFYMNSAGSATIKISGVEKSMSGNTGEMTFTSAEISALNIQNNYIVNSESFILSPNLDTVTVRAEDTSKIADLSYGGPANGFFSFTILFDQVADIDTLDFAISLDT